MQAAIINYPFKLNCAEQLSIFLIIALYYVLIETICLTFVNHLPAAIKLEPMQEEYLIETLLI